MAQLSKKPTQILLRIEDNSADQKHIIELGKVVGKTYHTDNIMHAVRNHLNLVKELEKARSERYEFQEECMRLNGIMNAVRGNMSMLLGISTDEVNDANVTRLTNIIGKHIADQFNPILKNLRNDIAKLQPAKNKEPLKHATPLKKSPTKKETKK